MENYLDLKNNIVSKQNNKIFLFLFLMSCGVVSTCLAQYKISSPNGRISAEILLKGNIYYSVSFKDELVLEASPLSITIDGLVLGKNPRLLKVDSSSVDEKKYPVWGSRKEITDRYNRLALQFDGGFSIEFRAFDQGLAYRFNTNMKKKEVIVNDEEVAYRFPFGTTAWIATDQSYETNYQKTSLDVEQITDFNNNLNKIYLPVAIQATDQVKLLITEADLRGYPSLFLDRGNDYENYLLGTFEPYTLSTKRGGFSNYSLIANANASYIAKTSGTRSYPWRLMVISDDDRTFVDCDLVYQLASPQIDGETGWIKPGKVAWDWWHDYAVEGEEFVGGVNSETYLYHIDFAAKYGLEYILIDWLWTDKYDLTLFNPEVDLKHIIDYATSKDVGVILWCPGHTLYNQMDEALDLFASYGAAGVKADFFGREDQTGIQMYEDLAKAAFRRKLLIDFHGCTKPTGLSRTYPNVINYEAVAGNEYNKLSQDKITVDHKVMLPFIRGLQGPMDFTPGGMRNIQTGHNLRFTLPQVHGTRSNEAALFVIYNEPLKMLCDAPSVYEREEDFTKLIASVPTTWDETIVLQASLGKYIVEARRSDDDWFVAGITGSTPHELILNFPFLKAGEYQMTLLKDGPNASRIGTDYLLSESSLSNTGQLSIRMAHGGGFLIHIEPMQN
ncbi:MAG: glycoside hydrolase family 97 protein [Cyclobacteriaceae bacterium]